MKNNSKTNYLSFGIIIGVVLILIGLITSKNSSSYSNNTLSFQELNTYSIPKRTPTPKIINPSDKALGLTVYFFSLAKENEKTEIINKFSNRAGNLSDAMRNFALILDSKKEAMALVEAFIASYVINKLSQSGGNSTSDELEDIKNKLDDIESRERRECYDKGGYFSSTFGCN